MPVGFSEVLLNDSLIPSWSEATEKSHFCLITSRQQSLDLPKTSCDQTPGDQPVHFFCTSKVITLEAVYVKIDAEMVLAAGTDYLWTCLLAHTTANDSIRGRVKKRSRMPVFKFMC